MSALEGLLLHEIIFLFLGILLFLVLLFVLVYFVLNKRAIKSLPFFFVIPILMIGWPSVEKIKFSGALGDLEIALRNLEVNPSDSTALAAVHEGIDRIEKRPVSNATTLLTLADARAAVGDTTEALTYVTRVLKDQPDLPAAIDRRDNLVIPKVGIDIRTSRLQQNPSDSAARIELEKSISAMEKLKVASPDALLKLAKAKAAIGDTAKASMYVDSVLKRVPTLEEAVKLKKDLRPIKKP